MLFYCLIGGMVLAFVGAVAGAVVFLAGAISGGGDGKYQKRGTRMFFGFIAAFVGLVVWLVQIWR